MQGGEAFGGNFFVGETIVAQIAVAIAVIPFVALRTPTARANFDDNEAELRKRDVGAFWREGFVHFLGLRAGIYELDERVFAGRVEVEGFVHNAVKIGDAVFGFDFKGFREFEACFEKLRDVGGFEIEEMIALRIHEDGFGGSVHAGKSVFKNFAGIGSAEGVREIAGSEQLQAGAVEADAIEMDVVGIFIFFAPIGGEEESAGFFVERNDLIGDEFAGGDLVFKLAGGIEEVVVAPAVAFGPPDKFRAVADEAERLDAEPDVGALGDESFRDAAGGVGDANIDLAKIAVRADEVELVGSVG